LGFGVAVEKSFTLSLLSVHPSDFLNAAVVLSSVRIGAEPSKQFALFPKPTKSAIPSLGKGQILNGTLEFGFTNMIFPEFPRVCRPSWLSELREAPFPLGVPICIKRYCPGWIGMELE